MKHYVVIFEDSAQADVRESYDWGCRAWGKREAQEWARQLRTAVFKQLGVVPRAFPLAPEDAEFSEEIRQLVVGRYRVLFTIKGRKVHVLPLQRSLYCDRLISRGSRTRYELRIKRSIPPAF